MRCYVHHGASTTSQAAKTDEHSNNKFTLPPLPTLSTVNDETVIIPQRQRTLRNRGIAFHGPNALQLGPGMLLMPHATRTRFHHR
jgi:hypothetical protein